jgi:hypothetical protein
LTPDDRAGDPIAWTAIAEHQGVVSSDGHKVGTVGEVLGTGEVGIFHGLAVRTHLFSHEVEVPAEDVGRITANQVALKIDVDAFKELPRYEEERSYTLGISGLFRKRPSWREDDSHGGR